MAQCEPRNAFTDSNFDPSTMSSLTISEETLMMTEEKQTQKDPSKPRSERAYVLRHLWSWFFLLTTCLRLASADDVDESSQLMDGLECCDDPLKDCCPKYQYENIKKSPPSLQIPETNRSIWHLILRVKNKLQKTKPQQPNKSKILQTRSQIQHALCQTDNDLSETKHVVIQISQVRNQHKKNCKQLPKIIYLNIQNQDILTQTKDLFPQNKDQFPQAKDYFSQTNKTRTQAEDQFLQTIKKRTQTEDHFSLSFDQHKQTKDQPSQALVRFTQSTKQCLRRLCRLETSHDDCSAGSSSGPYFLRRDPSDYEMARRAALMTTRTMGIIELLYP